MIVSPTDFRGILSIGANLYTEVADTTTAANIKSLEQSISVYETEYLYMLFGESVSDLQEYLQGGESVTDWSAIAPVLHGDETHLSPIACYIYFNALHDLAEVSTQMGVVTSADDDARSPKNKQVRAWNMMCDIHARTLFPAMYDAGLKLPDGNEFRKLSTLGI